VAPPAPPIGTQRPSLWQPPAAPRQPLRVLAVPVCRSHSRDSASDGSSVDGAAPPPCIAVTDAVSRHAALLSALGSCAVEVTTLPHSPDAVVSRRTAALLVATEALDALADAEQRSRDSAEGDDSAMCGVRAVTQRFGAAMAPFERVAFVVQRHRCRQQDAAALHRLQMTLVTWHRLRDPAGPRPQWHVTASDAETAELLLGLRSEDAAAGVPPFALPADGRLSALQRLLCANPRCSVAQAAAVPRGATLGEVAQALRRASAAATEGDAPENVVDWLHKT
jgi:hypothetical protein